MSHHPACMTHWKTLLAWVANKVRASEQEMSFTPLFQTQEYQSSHKVLEQCMASGDEVGTRAACRQQALLVNAYLKGKTLQL